MSTEETHSTHADAGPAQPAPANVDLYALAQAVLALMKHEVRLERDRLGFDPYARTRG